MLGECSTRFHLEMLPLGMPYLKDVPCMGLVRKLNILNRCKKTVYSQMISLHLSSVILELCRSGE